jgi:hypothetical protein
MSIRLVHCVSSVGVASWANQNRGEAARQRFSKNSRANLEQLFGHCGPTSRRLISRSVSGSASAERSSTSTANASLQGAPSSPSFAKSTVRSPKDPRPERVRLGHQKDVLCQAGGRVRVIAFKGVNALANSGGGSLVAASLEGLVRLSTGRHSMSAQRA